MKLTIKAGSESMEMSAREGARLDDVILSSGILLDRPCGGRGKCGKCRVRVSGDVSPQSEIENRLLGAEAVEKGERLSCQVLLRGDTEVTIERPAVFTDKSFRATPDLSDIEGPLGLALDLGTTTVGAFIVELEQGRVHAGSACLNRQASIGAEVMTRLQAAERNPDNLQSLAWESMVEAAGGLELDARLSSRVERAMVVGNSAMHHLALGLPVKPLLRSPFEPHQAGRIEADPGPLKSLFPSLQQVSFAPLIGGFVGSDALACLVYFGFDREGETALAVDLGTNGEVLLASGGDIWAASTAAGPAFEGVNISCGMRALPGAVTRVNLDEDGGLKLVTVGDEPPRGMTGSGLLSAVMALRNLGVIDSSGRMADPGEIGPVRVEEKDGIRSAVLVPGLCLTQQDVRELQKAKGAIKAAVEILVERAGLSPGSLDRVVLTGSFGGKVDPGDVEGLGVTPPLPEGRTWSIANGAGFGAAQMLDSAELDRACELAGRVRHVELNLDPGFMDRYVTGMALAPEPGRR